jgi:Ras-related protein Rab-1A
MVYDVTSEESFEHVEEWLSEVNRHASESTIKVIVGNKADLIDKKVVSTEKAQRFAENLNISFLETSAKNATNVETAFLTVAQELIENQKEDTSGKTSGIGLRPVEANSGSNKGCPCS